MSDSGQQPIINEGSKLEIRVFDAGEPSPFLDLNYSEKNVYEFADYTLRTPLEKTDAFYELLHIPYPCEMFVLPVTEQINSYMNGLSEQKANEKTSALFQFLAAVKDTVHRDRTFLVADKEFCALILEEAGKLGFSLKEMNRDELQDITLSN